MKLCCTCRQEQPETEFFRDRSRKDGLTAQCKACKRIQDAKWRAANPDKVRARRKRFAEARPERVKAYMDAWRAAHPEYAAMNNRRWRERSPEKYRQWYRDNPGRIRERDLRRRARKLAATVGPVDLELLWETNEGRCQLCGDPIDRTLAYPHPLSASVDHIVPLARGGTHEQSNLQWTHLVENIRKGANVPALSPALKGEPQ